MSFPLVRRALVASLVASLALAAAAATRATELVPGNAAAAKSTFNSKCSACHKPDGTGGVKLTGNATPNWKDAKTWADPKRKEADTYLRDCITNGKLPSGMVAWGKTGQLKPQEIENLIAYIHLLASHK